MSEISKIKIGNIVYDIAGSGGGAGLTEITYSELVSLRNESGLTPGGLYRVTDYETITVQDNTRSAGHVFDIIVTALNEYTLSENASAIQHSGDTYFADSNLNAWQVWYCLDNDKTRFAWADDENGKGVIYRLIDEYNNDCPYDFKNIQFKRYEITACTKSPDLVGRYSIEGLSNITVDTSATYWCYTFSMINLFEDVVDDVSVYQRKYPSEEGYACLTHDNVFRKYISYIDGETELMILPNNVMVTDTENASISEDYSYGEFYAFYSNTFGNNCNNNTFGNSCFSNTFGDYCGGNTFGNDCGGNTFGNSCYYNTFGNNCGGNTFGNDCNNNTFGNNCNYNTFGNECYNNTFVNRCFSNTFGNSCYSNTFGDYCDGNTFGNGCYNNTFGNDCYNNTFGNNFQNNTFRNNIQYSTFNEGIQQLTLSKDYVRYLIVENSVSYVTLTSSQTTSSSNWLQNIAISCGVVGTSNNRKVISHNTVNDEFKTTYQSADSQIISI